MKTALALLLAAALTGCAAGPSSTYAPTYRSITFEDKSRRVCTELRQGVVWVFSCPEQMQ